MTQDNRLRDAADIVDGVRCPTCNTLRYVDGRPSPTGRCECSRRKELRSDAAEAYEWLADHGDAKGLDAAAIVEAALYRAYRRAGLMDQPDEQYPAISAMTHLRALDKRTVRHVANGKTPKWVPPRSRPNPTRKTTEPF